MMVTLMQHTSIKQSISAQQMYEPTHTKKRNQNMPNIY